MPQQVIKSLQVDFKYLVPSNLKKVKKKGKSTKTETKKTP